MQDTGISPAGYASLLAIWSGTKLLFEIPSGVVGDLFSRKTVLIIADLIRATAFATWLVWPTYSGFALGFIIWSLGSAFHSGTSEAFLYESLTRKKDFEKVYGRTQAAYSVGVAMAFLIGGYIAESGYQLPLILSILGPVGAALLIAAFPAKQRAATSSSNTPTFMHVLKSGWHTVTTVRLLAVIITMSAVLATIPGILDEYLGVLLDADGFSLTAVGLTYALVLMGRTLGTLVAHRLKSSSLIRLALLPVVASLLYIVTTGAPKLLFVAGLVAYFGLFGIFDVLLGSRLQNAVTDYHRATVTSVAGMAVEGSAIVYALAIGILAHYYGWSTAFLLSNMAGICFALIFVVRVHRLNHN